MNSLHVKEIAFKEIERIFFEIGCEVSRKLLENFLAAMNKELNDSRDKKTLRHKGNRTTVIKTLMGEVEVKRSMYKKVSEAGEVGYVYLLDKALGMETIGNISPNLVEKILDNICEMSYREVSKAITGLTNQSISHQGVWNVVKVAGERQQDAEKDLVETYERQELSGEKEVPVLFEEADGVWLSMQGKDRRWSSKGKREMKVGVVYEGWEKRYPLSKEYRTVGKMAYAGYVDAEEFKAIRDASVAEKYNTDEIRYRILNGDGAKWIVSGHDTEECIFQLDPYHLSKNVIRNVSDKRSRGHILRWLKAGEFEKAFKKLEELKYESGGEEKEIKKLITLEGYIRNNIDGIVSYKEREGVEIPKAPEGMEYRNLGTMERNVNTFVQRMKNGKSWSIEGATNLSKIIALKIGEGFNDKIASLVSGKVSERLRNRFNEAIEVTKDNIDKAVKKSVYPMQRGEIPFTGSKMTYSRRGIRNIVNLKPFSEIPYK